MRLKKYGFSVLGSAFILLGVSLAARWQLAAAQPETLTTPLLRQPRSAARLSSPKSIALSPPRSLASAKRGRDGENDFAGQDQAPAETSTKEEDSAIAVAPPPFSEGIFPCSTCHDPKDKVNITPRPLSFHDDIVFKHDEKNRWCLDCHDANNRDRLHLSGGRPVEFSQSYELCGQCHGPQLRDWKVGEHGKRTGSWSGRKEYLLCAHCHDPHAPKFKPLKPLPAPLFPEGLL